MIIGMCMERRNKYKDIFIWTTDINCIQTGKQIHAYRKKTQFNARATQCQTMININTITHMVNDVIYIM